MNFGIATKSALVLAFVGAIVASTTGFYAYQASRDLLVDSVQGELLTATQVLARRVTQTQQEVSRNLQILASQAEAVAVLEREDGQSADHMALLFQSVMAANPSYFQIRLISAASHGLERVRVDRARNTLVRIGGADLQEKGHYPYVYETLALPAGASYLSRLVINREVGAHGALGQPTAQMAMPVESPQGKTLGLVVISVDLNGTFNLLRADLPQEFQLFFANGEGDFLIHPDPALSFGFDKGRRFFVFDEFPATSALVDGQAGEIVTEANTGLHAERPVVAAFIIQKVKIASGEGRLILGLAQPRDSVVKLADRLGTVTLQIVAGLTFLSIFIALILGRLVTRSINALSTAVQSFTGSNTVEGLPLRRQDEIGALARSFDRMQHQIRQQLAELELHRHELQQLAYHDPLTGLPNRSLYHDRLRQAFSAAQRGGDKVALMLLDVDRFKYVNDTLGHQAGDELLKMVAERVVGRVRETDTVARLGGDEFTVVLPSIKDLSGIDHIAQSIVDLLAKPFSLNGQDVYVGASIGISIYPDDALDGETLNKNADMAMYKAKESGRGRYHFYQSKMDAQAQKRMTLECNLRRALVHEEFRVFYQPKIDIREHKIIGMEALVRWFDPDKGMISPADFIPIAEENGMIIFIDQLVLRAACSQLRLWLDAGWDLRVAVNLSALQFRQSDLVEIVGGVLTEYDLSPGLLELEITESAIMDDPDAATTLIQGLRDLGVYISIDDFGTGYSSLAYLKKFPINTLKIDQAFVHDLTWDSDDAAIVRSVIALSEGLSLNVVAEGIETEEQRAFLLEHNCANGQGYYYSKPLPADEFEALLKTGLK